MLFVPNLYLIPHINPSSISAQRRRKLAQRTNYEYYRLQLKIARQLLRATTMYVMFQLRAAGKYLRVASMSVMFQLRAAGK